MRVINQLFIFTIMKDYFKKIWAWLTGKTARVEKLIADIQNWSMPAVWNAFYEGVPKARILEAIIATKASSFIADAFTRLWKGGKISIKDLVDFYVGITPENASLRFSALMKIRSILTEEMMMNFAKAETEAHDHMNVPRKYGNHTLNVAFDCSAHYYMTVGDNMARIFWAWAVLHRYSGWKNSTLEYPYVEELLRDAVSIYWNLSEKEVGFAPLGALLRDQHPLAYEELKIQIKSVAEKAPDERNLQQLNHSMMATAAIICQIVKSKLLEPEKDEWLGICRQLGCHRNRDFRVFLDENLSLDECLKTMQEIKSSQK